jgi:1-deoxy-D-xylulose-5-phosphate reductoisomerase
VRSVALCGSTGSIGVQTLDVMASSPDEFELSFIAAGTSVMALAQQAAQYRPSAVGVADETAASELAGMVPAGVEVVAGPAAVAAAASDADVVVNGVMGFAGLPVTLATLHAGKRLALAHKESLIAAGPVVQRARLTPGAELIPVDSEHCALHQCLRANDSFDSPDRTDQVERLVLTASGGPFRGLEHAALASVGIAEALAHPTWDMGPKITVDSSTLMNKGLEVIEARELFGIELSRVEVVVHPQSIVHSMVEFTDGATIAQLSLPDMRLCIGYALAFPDRLQAPFGRIDWSALARLDFEPPDLAGFPCLELAYAAAALGDTGPATLSAANEVAVDAFLTGRIAWIAIPAVIEQALESDPGIPVDSLDVVLEADRLARENAANAINRSLTPA